MIQRTIQRLRDSPKQVLEKARRGSIPDLKDLGNFWKEVPDLVPLGVLDVFFLHLSADKAFTEPSPANERSPAAERAFYALLGLSKSAECLLPGASHHRDPAVLKAWPGIFKWSAFIFRTRVISVPPRPAEVRRAAMDVIAMVWYCLVRADGLREVIADTKGTVEIATQLWLLDDEVPYSNFQPPIPCGAAVLDAVLVDRAATDRALSAAGCSADRMVKIALSRARSALSGSSIVPAHLVIHLDLLSHFSYGRDHPLRLRLLQAGVIPFVTAAAGALARALNAGGDLGFLDGIISCFGYLANCLESTEGFTWVTQSLKADLLIALADSSPHFARLDEEDYEMVCSLLKKTLPTYLVYRSVIQATDEGMRRFKAEQLNRVNTSIAKDIWVDFQKLAEERRFVVLQAVAVKGKAATCDNVQCHKVDAKNTFRKCGACSTTLYCSKECQTIAWKEGGHKAMCQMKRQERLEGKSQAITKSDAAFFHHLSTRDARHHLPLLRRLARSNYPTLRSCELLIRIDYTIVPPVYSVVPLTEADRHDTPTNGSPNAVARNDALLERVRENPDRFGLIQSKVVNGVALQLVLSVVTGNFWEHGDAEDFEFDDSDDALEESLMDTGVDDVDLMMARTSLNRFLASRGEPPAF
ncbi:hypothetical protein C8R45DRAFT_1039529 [Mycena sanguinolenta]|nr:hypothetical protein C8R45DRAFT_1039529 [Mycena sanguinolenta]